jgi:hypothetical protein
MPETYAFYFQGIKNMKRRLIATIALTLLMMTSALAAVDANHPDLSDQSDKQEYAENPALYSKGWHDGWIWASALPDKNDTLSDVCEKICRKKYGDIDEDGSDAKTEFSGFLAAAAFVREHQPHKSDADAELSVRPAENGWGGCPGGWVTQEAIKQLVDNPNSCKFASATEPQLVDYNGKKCWFVVVQFRTKNARGGEDIGAADVYMIGGEPPSIIQAHLRGGTELSSKPADNGWDECPGGWVTQEAIKQLAGNPGACKFDSATEPQLVKYNGKSCWLVVVQFRTKNAQGGDDIGVADVYLIGGEPASIISARLRLPSQPASSRN